MSSGVVAATTFIGACTTGQPSVWFGMTALTAFALARLRVMSVDSSCGLSGDGGLQPKPAIVALGRSAPHTEPEVRIHFPPAARQERTGPPRCGDAGQYTDWIGTAGISSPRASAPLRVRLRCPWYDHPGSKAETREDGNMRRSLTRIRTSHVGRLPPPKI